MYCQTCEIEYKTDSELYDDEYVRGCPMCMMKDTIKQLRTKLTESTLNLNRYRICEKCQQTMGDCDMDRNICAKLKAELAML